MRDRNEDEVVQFAKLARETGYHIRFIEYMPLDAQDEWKPKSYGGQVIERIAASVSPDRRHRQHAGAGDALPVRRRRPGARCDHPFGSLSRSATAVTVCGSRQMASFGRACLLSRKQTLKGPMRAGASDDELAALARACVAAKWAGHRIGQVDYS